MDIDKETFRSIEGKLYSYYRKKRENEIDRLNNKIKELEKQIEEIERDIKTTNVKIDYFQGAMPISERVQTSCTGTSFAESQILRAIGDMEKERARRIATKLKSREKLRETEDFISDMDQIINSITSKEDRNFIEFKYKENKDMFEITEKLNMSKTTVYRKRKEIVEVIAAEVKGMMESE